MQLTSFILSGRGIKSQVIVLNFFVCFVGYFYGLTLLFSEYRICFMALVGGRGVFNIVAGGVSGLGLRAARKLNPAVLRPVLSAGVFSKDATDDRFLPAHNGVSSLGGMFSPVRFYSTSPGKCEDAFCASLEDLVSLAKTKSPHEVVVDCNVRIGSKQVVIPEGMTLRVTSGGRITFDDYAKYIKLGKENDKAFPEKDADGKNIYVNVDKGFVPTRSYSGGFHVPNLVEPRLIIGGPFEASDRQVFYFKLKDDRQENPVLFNASTYDGHREAMHVSQVKAIWFGLRSLNNDLEILLEEEIIGATILGRIEKLIEFRAKLISLTDSGEISKLELEIKSFIAGLFVNKKIKAFFKDEELNEALPLPDELKRINEKFLELLNLGLKFMEDVASQNVIGIQRAIFAGVYVGDIKLPAGHFYINDTLQLANPVFSLIPSITFSTLSLSGSGIFENGTTLNFSLRKRQPAINIALSRYGSVSDIRIFGSNSQPEKNWTYFNSKSGGGFDKLANPNEMRTAFLDNGWSTEGCSNGPTNLYAGIATDSFVNSYVERKIKDGFYSQPSKSEFKTIKGKLVLSYDEDVPHPTYKLHSPPPPVPPAKIRDYSGSTHVEIRNVLLERFVSGVAISAGSIIQNDDVRIRDNTILKCTYGITLGTTQARICSVSNNSITEGLTAIDNISFVGELDHVDGLSVLRGPSVNMYSNQYGNLVDIYRLDPGGGGQSVIDGDYAEASLSMGHFGNLPGSNYTASPIAVVGGSYNFSSAGSKMRFLAGNSGVDFSACTFIHKGQFGPDFYLHAASRASRLVFRTCAFSSSGNFEFPRFFFPLKDGSGLSFEPVHFDNCSVRHETGLKAMSSTVHVDVSAKSAERIPVGLETKKIFVNHVSDREYQYARYFQFPIMKGGAPADGGWSISFSDVKGLRDKSTEEATTYEAEIVYPKEKVKLVPRLFVGDRIYSGYASRFNGTVFGSYRYPIWRVKSWDSTGKDSNGVKVVIEVPKELRFDIDPFLNSNPLYGESGFILPREENMPFLAFNMKISGHIEKVNPRKISVTLDGYDHFDLDEIHRLKKGDFVNTEFFPIGTRIVELNETPPLYPSVSTDRGVLTLTVSHDVNQSAFKVKETCINIDKIPLQVMKRIL